MLEQFLLLLFLKHLNEVIANANPFGENGHKDLWRSNFIKFTRDGVYL